MQRLAIYVSAFMLMLAARGETPAAFGAPNAAAALGTPFGRRCIAALGATLDFHHGPLGRSRDDSSRYFLSACMSGSPGGLTRALV